MVKFRTAEKSGTIIIDGNQHFLYLVQPGQQAIPLRHRRRARRFGWAGIVRVGRTAEWPIWTPPAEMVARDPNARKWASGQPGRSRQPARRTGTLSLRGRPGHDLSYPRHARALDHRPRRVVRCIRMNNNDIVDLHSRIEVGTKVIVADAGRRSLQGACDVFKGGG